MKKKFRSAVVLLSAITMTITSVIPSYAAYWRGNEYVVNNAYTYKDGWHEIDGYWYYFNQDGKAAVNTVTPDGYQVNEKGQWVENGAAKYTTDLQSSVKQFQDERNLEVGSYAAAGNDYYQLIYGNKAADAKAFYDSTVNELSKYFGSFDWLHASEGERVRKAYERLAVGHNGNTYGADQYSSYNWSVLVKRNGNCKDYAYDLAELLKLSGLQSYRLSIPDYPGFSHVGVLVKADNKWYALDPAVGDGIAREVDPSMLKDFNSGATLYEIQHNLNHGYTGMDYNLTGEPNRQVSIEYSVYNGLPQTGIGTL